MKTNKEGVDLIKRFEGLHDGNLSIIGLQPKRDPIGIWTEGYGRAMRYNGTWLKGYRNKDLAYSLATIHTEAEAEQALKDDLLKFENIVKKRLKVAVNENQFSALVSHTYNTGGSTTMFRLVNENASDYAIRKWFEDHYVTASGVHLRGLVLRRKAEADLFFRNPCE